MKKKYNSPKISIITIELEHTIAASSAIIQPFNENNVVQDEWETESDSEQTFGW